MDPRHITRLLAAAAALTALGTALAGAQDTTKTRPRSTKSIPISKEGGSKEGGRTAAGEVAKAVHDTVTVYRTDTLRLTAPPVTMHDTVRMTNTVTRVDTVQLQPIVRPVRFPNGLYFGLGAGLSTPNGAIFNPNNSGPTGQAQIGWQNAKTLLGVRGDVNWTQPQEDAGFVVANQSHAQIVNFSADLKAQLPFLHHTFGTNHFFSFYGIGGFTYTMFKNLPMRIDSPPGTAVFAQGTDSWQNQGGWNAGGGASLMWGRTEIFFETRVLAFNPSNAPMVRQMPFMLGLNLF
ncbi:MAG TPA: hypothetical protein VEU08_11200 [Vicinamibacterales bacterium]|nr:hypothetical protein [Vicinamibacterales bacterium]